MPYVEPSIEHIFYNYNPSRYHHDELGNAEERIEKIYWEDYFVLCEFASETNACYTSYTFCWEYNLPERFTFNTDAHYIQHSLVPTYNDTKDARNAMNQTDYSVVAVLQSYSGYGRPTDSHACMFVRWRVKPPKAVADHHNANSDMTTNSNRQLFVLPLKYNQLSRSDIMCMKKEHILVYFLFVSHNLMNCIEMSFSSAKSHKDVLLINRRCIWLIETLHKGAVLG